MREDALVRGERELKRHIKRMQVVGSILESKDERKNNNEGGPKGICLLLAAVVFLRFCIKDSSLIDIFLSNAAQ